MENCFLYGILSVCKQQSRQVRNFNRITLPLVSKLISAMHILVASPRVTLTEWQWRWNLFLDQLMWQNHGPDFGQQRQQREKKTQKIFNTIMEIALWEFVHELTAQTFEEKKITLANNAKLLAKRLSRPSIFYSLTEQYFVTTLQLFHKSYTKTKALSGLTHPFN